VLTRCPSRNRGTEQQASEYGPKDKVFGFPFRLVTSDSWLQSAVSLKDVVERLLDQIVACETIRTYQIESVTFAAQLQQADTGYLFSHAFLDRIGEKEGRRRNPDVANATNDAIKILVHVPSKYDPYVEARDEVQEPAARFAASSDERQTAVPWK
jgi:hypothetical protein